MIQTSAYGYRMLTPCLLCTRLCRCSRWIRSKHTNAMPRQQMRCHQTSAAHHRPITTTNIASIHGAVVPCSHHLQTQVPVRRLRTSKRSLHHPLHRWRGECALLIYCVALVLTPDDWNSQIGPRPVTLVVAPAGCCATTENRLRKR